MKSKMILLAMMGVGSLFYACTDYIIKDHISDTGDPAFVGSQACLVCHQEIYDITKESGMYNALIVVENEQPLIPLGSENLVAPDDYSWEDVAFVIGGYKWSANFVSKGGYVITQKTGSQFNLEDETRVHYKPEVENGRQEFVCGECHTTGWGQVSDKFSAHAISAFPELYYEEGVRCEACHGPGSAHLADPSSSTILVDNTPELCATCHQSNDDNSILSMGRFIAIGQQYEEWHSSDHREENVTCNSCHNPHASTVHEDAAGEGVGSCNSCHTDMNADKHFAMNIGCTECHMPKSLVIALEENPYKGDASAHIFKINTDASYSMFSEDGFVNKEGKGLSLDYVCYQCHKDENGAGGKFSQRSMMALSQKAVNFHE